MTVLSFGQSFLRADGAPVRIRRPGLVARWRRAVDGKLECRWARAETQDLR